jgi:membrane-anchored glycerophosphoryl diester phosphodiesterase (GDPDase)
LFSALVMLYWMTPIALDHAASDSLWEAAKIASLAAAGISARISWRLSSGVAHAFYVGNMVWMAITAGMLYQETNQQLCNAYLWDDQAVTGQALVVASIIVAVIWMLILAAQTMPRVRHS